MRWMVFVLLLCACRAPASKLSPGTVVSYGVGHREGSVSFSVNADGTAEYRSTGDPSGPIQARAKVTPEELRELAEVLRENDFCGLRSTRSTGVPDEASPSVSVRLEDIDCQVEMWDGEWRDDPEAKACLHAVESLGSTIRKRGAPARKSGLPEGEWLRYGVNHRDGSVSLVARHDGSADYGAGGWGNVKGTVTAQERAQLTVVLRDNDFCALRSKREVGVPDEARPSIAVELPEGLACEVTMWDGEWRDDPRARACLGAVEELAGKIRKRTKR